MLIGCVSIRDPGPGIRDPGSGIRKRELSDSRWELEAGDRSLSTNKRGRRSPPFSCGCGSLTLLAALLLPALSSFLCHCAQSPLSLWDPNREGLSPSLQRRCLLARRPASVGARRVALPQSRKICEQKIGGVSTRHPQSSDGAL